MKFRRILRNIIILLIVSCNIGCDQISKTIIRNKISYNESISLLNNRFTITKVENSGAFLSLGDALPSYIKFMILCLIPLLVLLLSIYMVMTKTGISRTLITGICFVIGGGFGNLYDRFVYGSVTDFMHIDFILFRTGIFNMADVSIMFGMVIIMAELYFSKRHLALADGPISGS